MKNEIVLFTDGDINIEVQINPEQETVWLTQKQMGELFNVKQATLSEHINNIISSGELNETSIGFSDKSSRGRKMSTFYILLIVLSGAYLTAQTIAWIFFGKSFFPDSGMLFENKCDKNLWQTVFPKNMLRLVIVIFSGATAGLLMNIVIPEGWITLPLAAVCGITINFIISKCFYDKI